MQNEMSTSSCMHISELKICKNGGDFEMDLDFSLRGERDRLEQTRSDGAMCGLQAGNNRPKI